MARRLYPKRLILGSGGGGGTLGPLDVNFLSDPTATTGGLFRPLAANQNGVTAVRWQTGSGSNIFYRASSDPYSLVPNTETGSYDLTVNRGLQINLHDNFTAACSGTNNASGVNLIPAALSLDGVGAVNGGYNINVGREINTTDSTDFILAADGAGTAIASITLGKPAYGAQTSVGLYFEVNGGGNDRIGYTYNGVDQGFIQNGGSDWLVTFPSVCFFRINTTNRGPNTDTQDGNAITGAYVFDEPLMTENAAFPAGYFDWNGNAL